MELFSHDPHVKTEWLVYKFGRAHVLFHAVRLDSNFIIKKVVQELLANASLSRYYVRRLLMYFGAYEKTYRTLKMEHIVKLI